MWVTVVPGSVCKASLGKLIRDRFLPQNPHGEQQPMVMEGYPGYPDFKRLKRLLRKTEKNNNNKKTQRKNGNKTEIIVALFWGSEK